MYNTNILSLQSSTDREQYLQTSFWVINNCGKTYNFHQCCQISSLSNAALHAQTILKTKLEKELSFFCFGDKWKESKFIKIELIYQKILCQIASCIYLEVHANMWFRKRRVSILTIFVINTFSCACVRVSSCTSMSMKEDIHRFYLMSWIEQKDNNILTKFKVICKVPWPSL